ncbi:FCP1 homology domain [Dillenia turbinata]|uniref:FCP1 homology domain n=1 Tax=Dillenia turbinata TaxID=194707 RepID=A0AAN8VFV7_9MAGN
MVSKITRKTPTKTIKDCRSRRRKKSPVKNTVSAASSVVLASINKSFRCAHAKLTKIFSRSARITTPNRRKGYKVLKKCLQEDLCKALCFENPLLPPLQFPAKRTIFLDLDETLIHSKTDPPPEKFDFIVTPKINGEIMTFYVLKRPGVDEFLEKLRQKFEIIVFTAGLREYASLILDQLDEKSLISHRLYRDSCREIEGRFVKDLGNLGRDLKSLVIVDDNPNAYSFQRQNAIPIRPFIDDLEDCELRKLMGFLEGCDEFDDMRDHAKQFVSLSQDGDEFQNVPT